jgi:hypothetical protein
VLHQTFLSFLPYRADTCSGNALHLYSRGCSLRISAGTPAILIEAFRVFSQSLQANTRIILRLRRERFLLNSLQFIIHQSTWHSALSGLLTDSSVKQPAFPFPLPHKNVAGQAKRSNYKPGSKAREFGGTALARRWQS